MQYFKLQIGCMLIVLYVAFIYIREKYEYKVKQKEPVFELLLITGILSIAFDGATAYTVNYLDKVPGLSMMCFMPAFCADWMHCHL